MYIFIDESGNFMPSGSAAKICAVSALVIPEYQADEIICNFEGLKSSWGVVGKEIKGSRLDERQISDVINLLRHFEVLLCISCIDTGSHSQSAIASHKQDQADLITKHITPRHSQTVVADLNELRQKTLHLSDQLYAQFITSVDLYRKVIAEVLIYYVLRKPQELGHFGWIIDAKGPAITSFETLLTTLTLPMVASTLSVDTVEGADYSHFEKYFKTLTDPPVYWQHVEPKSSYDGIDFGRLLRDDLKFADSSSELGLQLIDILSNAFCRAMNGRLKESGWSALGSLTVSQPQVISMIRLDDIHGPPGTIVTHRNYYGYVVERMRDMAKPMIPDYLAFP